MPCSEAVLGLGSNLPYKGKESRIVLCEALSALERILSNMRRSSFYETEPVGVADQGRFINCAAAGMYCGGAGELLYVIHAVEASLGRNRIAERRWGERTLDIDILLFGGLIINDEPLLTIPHPRLKERRFALEPLLELFPEAEEPVTGISYRSICNNLPPQGVIRINGAS